MLAISRTRCPELDSHTDRNGKQPDLYNYQIIEMYINERDPRIIIQHRASRHREIGAKMKRRQTFVWHQYTGGLLGRAIL
jgi:hypothetical protein